MNRPVLPQLAAVPDVLSDASMAVGLVSIAVLAVRAGRRWNVDRRLAAFVDAVAVGDWRRAELIAAELLPSPPSPGGRAAPRSQRTRSDAPRATAEERRWMAVRLQPSSAPARMHRGGRWAG